MDGRILAAVAAVSLLILVGAVAASMLYRGMSPQAALENMTRNWTRQNLTWNCGFGANTSFNSTQLEQFRQAVMSGDYQTAKSLHDEYGFGGKLFDKLNETTFAQYSQIQNLTSELGSEIGSNAQFGVRTHLGGFIVCRRLVINHHPANRNH